MGVGNRPAACASCGKRLTYKHWYYRNGKHCCNKRCWVTENEKQAKEQQAKEQESAKEATAAKVAPAAKEAPAPAKEAAS